MFMIFLVTLSISTIMLTSSQTCDLAVELSDHSVVIRENNQEVPIQPLRKDNARPAFTLQVDDRPEQFVVINTTFHGTMSYYKEAHMIGINSFDPLGSVVYHSKHAFSRG